jgi:hypothetical protein
LTAKKIYWEDVFSTQESQESGPKWKYEDNAREVGFIYIALFYCRCKEQNAKRKRQLC